MSITVVQTAGAVIDTGTSPPDGTVTQVSFASPVTKGNTIIVMMDGVADWDADPSQPPFITASDDVGNMYSVISDNTLFPGEPIAVGFICQSSIGAAVKITLTQPNFVLWALEVSPQVQVMSPNIYCDNGNSGLTSPIGYNADIFTDQNNNQTAFMPGPSTESLYLLAIANHVSGGGATAHSHITSVFAGLGNASWTLLPTKYTTLNTGGIGPIGNQALAYGIGSGNQDPNWTDSLINTGGPVDGWEYDGAIFIPVNSQNFCGGRNQAVGNPLL